MAVFNKNRLISGLNRKSPKIHLKPEVNQKLVKLEDHFSGINLFFSLFHHHIFFFDAGLQEKANPVGVVVHGEVGQPGAGVGVHADLVALLQAQQDGGAGHGVLVVVLVVLQ